MRTYARIPATIVSAPMAAFLALCAVRFAASAPLITSIEPVAPGSVSLAWNDTNLHGYVVEQSTGWPWKVSGFDFAVPTPGADPAATSSTGTIGTALSRFYRIVSGPPRDAFNHWDGGMGTPTNDFLIIIGTTNNDWFVQYGADGDDSFYLSCGYGNDWTTQYGGGGDDRLNAQGGTGNDTIFQRDEEGSNELGAWGGGGDDTVYQVSGDGRDHLNVMTSEGDDTITMIAGGGDDIIDVDDGDGDDVLFVDAGDGDDVITNSLSNGTCVGVIDGGNGTDSVRFWMLTRYCTVQDGEGRVLYRTGTGSVYTVVGVEDIRYSLSLYCDVWRVDLYSGEDCIVPIKATAEQAGDTLTFRKKSGPDWSTVTGQGTVSAPDDFVHGQISVHPPFDTAGTTWVYYYVTDNRGGRHGDAALLIHVTDP